MAFWIFVILAVVGYIGYAIAYLHENDIGVIFAIIAAIATAITVILLCLIISTHLSAIGEKTKLEQRYDALIYKSQTESIRDEFGIVNKDYIDEVQEWNESIASNQRMQRDFWVGIFTPNIYDDFELIDLDSIQFMEE